MTPQTADAGRYWISSEHAPSLRLRLRRRRCLLLLLLLLLLLPRALENHKFETMSGGENVAIPVEKLRFRSRASSSLEVSGDSHQGTRADESGGRGSSSSHAERQEQISLIDAANQVNWFRILDPRSTFNPHDKFVRHWNRVFFTSCLVAIFIDPLFFFVISVNEENKCILYQRSLAIGFAIVRSITDFFYLIHILIQFKMSYVAPDSTIVGTRGWETDPKKVAKHYLCGYFSLDLFVVLPLPQVIILVVTPNYWGISPANFAKKLLRVSVLLQYLPRIIRVLPLVVRSSTSTFVFESAWSNFSINILMFVLAGHVLGSCWYLFGLQRLNKCLRDACLIEYEEVSCRKFLYCTEEENYLSGWEEWENWMRIFNASSCLSSSGDFDYGIYKQTPNIAKKHSNIVRYVYSLFWGFQKINTLAGNQVPSDFVWEVLFTMSIIALGLLLFALLIGNVQHFLQSLGKRKLDMQLRRRDFEMWMRRRRMPPELKEKIRKSEKFSWSVTRGVNEEHLMENLPENLKIEIRRHLFAFLKEAPIFSKMEEPILDAFRQLLTRKVYLAMSTAQERGSPIDKMIFIVRGQMEIVGPQEVPLSEGGVCGEELLVWHLEAIYATENKGKGQSSISRPSSNRDVKCQKNVEAFVLSSSDLEGVIANFKPYLLQHREVIRPEIEKCKAAAAFE